MSTAARGAAPLPITPIEYPEDVRFVVPTQPTFSAGQSVLSILSLIFMSALSTIMMLQLLNPAGDVLAGVRAAVGDGILADVLSLLRPPVATERLPAWTWLPFAFTIFGATLGWLFELYLLITGTPFQQTRSRDTTVILQLRLMNLAPVTMTIFFFVSCLCIQDSSTRMGLLYLSGMSTFALGLALLFGGAEKPVGMMLPGINLLQGLMALLSLPLIGGSQVLVLLLVQAGLQIFSLMTTTATPIKSTIFHVSSTFSGLALYNALLVAVAAQPSLPFDVAPNLTKGSLLWWGFILFSLAGLVVAARTWPKTRANARSVISDLVWSPLWFLLTSADRFPNPKNLSELYKGNRPQPTSLAPYWVNHPQFLAPGLDIPSATSLEANVLAFTDVLKKAKQTFALIATLDHVLPQATTTVPLQLKPRMALWSDGSEYWPALYSMKLFGLTIPGRKLDPTPEPAIAAFKEGNLLGYLCESSIGNTMLRPVTHKGEAMLALDLRHLERYATKPDYASYGGIAYLKINPTRKRLEVFSVIGPHSDEELPLNIHSPMYRMAEAQIAASLYYQSISGKHLVEIHMTYNLVEVAMHNAFDAQGQWAHPVRAFMYLHFFSHELAEELTTEHLVQERAVFAQIFATTHDALIEHLDDCYNDFVYGTDEEFEARKEMMTIPSGPDAGQLLPHSAIVWELQYMEVFRRYTMGLIDAIYADDEAVANDPYVQALHTELLLVMLNGLPARYEGLSTRKGLALWAADTIQHVVVRHQVYGTTAVRAALDPRISKTQVAADGGATGVDEWRSLLGVALATARARFTLLMGDWKYLLDGVEPSKAQAMRPIFDRLQSDLQALELEWTRTEEDKRFNYDYFRAMPSDLHTGPGY